MVHPSIMGEVKGYLEKLCLKPTYMNNFMLVSKSSSLQHIYNIFNPISASPQFFDTLTSQNFDDNCMKENQVTVIQVNRS